MPEPLKFSASLYEKAGRPHRRDGGCGLRRALLLSHYAPDDKSPTCELLIEEIAPDGRVSTLLKRRRVDRPDQAASKNEVERLHPKGQPGGLYARLHWPALNCVLQAEDLVVGAALKLFNLDIRIEGAADENTRAWLEERGLPGSVAVVPPAPPPAAQSTFGQPITEELIAASAGEEAPLAFFLGGPRPQKPPRDLDEDDDASSLSLLRRRAAPLPSLRGDPIQQQSKGGMPMLPSEEARLARTLRHGANLRLVFLGRGDAGSGADGDVSVTRKFIVSFYVSDYTLSMTELHSHGAGSQFGRRGGAAGGAAERTTLLRRCRAPTANGAHVELADLFVGSAFVAAGTRLRLTCCEPSTRRLLLEGGLARELGCPAKVPPRPEAVARALAAKVDPNTRGTATVLKAFGEAWPGRDEEVWALE